MATVPPAQSRCAGRAPKPPATLHRQGHRGPRGPRARAQAPGHVHRRHRHARLPPPALGDRRQRRRRGHQRPRQAHRGDPRRRPQGRDGGRRRARHPGRRPPQVQEAGARAHPLHAARRRQVRQRQLQGLGRAPRRRLQRRQRALGRARRAGAARRLRAHPVVLARRPDRQAEEGRGHAEARHGHPLPARPADLRREGPLRRRSDPRAARGQGLPARRAHHRLPRRGHAASRSSSSTPTASPTTCPSLVAAARQAGDAPRAVLRRRRRTACGWRPSSSGPRRTDDYVRSYVNGIPTALGRHARERASTRPSPRRCATSSRRRRSSPRA